MSDWDLVELIQRYATKNEVYAYLQNKFHISPKKAQKTLEYLGIFFPEKLKKDIPKPVVTQARREELINISLQDD